jgi:hypothetical protein
MPHAWAHSGPHTLNNHPTEWLILALLVTAGAIMLGCLWYACLTGVFDDDTDA